MIRLDGVMRMGPPGRDLCPHKKRSLQSSPSVRMCLRRRSRERTERWLLINQEEASEGNLPHSTVTLTFPAARTAGIKCLLGEPPSPRQWGWGPELTKTGSQHLLAPFSWVSGAPRTCLPWERLGVRQGH